MRVDAPRLTDERRLCNQHFVPGPLGRPCGYAVAGPQPCGVPDQQLVALGICTRAFMLGHSCRA
jgi:hypothetical protein